MSWIVHEGDCLDPVTGLASLPDRSVDHVITDPPYEAEAHTLQRRVKGERGALADDGDGRVVRVAPLSFPPIAEADRLAVAREIARVVRRWAIVFCQAEAVASWRDALTKAGLVYKRACVWVKLDAQPQLSGDRPGMGYESIVLAHVRGRSRWNGGGKCGVYTFCKNSNNPVRSGHPTQKPLLLMEALVRDFTDPGELICDPFSGSGTTGVACRRLGRSFVGWERDHKYAAIARRRIDGAREQVELFAPRGPKPKQAGLDLGAAP
jgi:site-specific DNA-methyltransferase (adenine-specific)